ncbi:MAG: hypothetical protein A2383_00695 [Candidatus Pacebacteria bacterium RIFOXYB1_FULL_39_46]|nr:MAG: hypothetical protein A2182_00530 [Candidatus Pacebacteria bacterium RIFOXYA1_FULL_38_18]OGJ38105.1 MAG: hypothetical protein A2383_00695 [Candidatus Pacebacteria bacterium RIFOXYB1_FULL_39_46]OGJ39673.1 MAG: hypothetical protein A2411_02745 [Candidatus Pacebacteria bacterium RIFOXYC1_FULL_39_21]OGJ39857.1 MAG: hypothetical protein A2582_00460 [Candidatus Pacebacteria bacterium RIFOXYD1_FULL_39_27]
MFKKSLIIIPFQLPWNWSADYQMQTCLELAKNNLVVAYINADARFFLKPRPLNTFPSKANLLAYQPRYLIPFRRFAWIEKLNQLLNLWYLLIRYGRGKQHTVLWIFDSLFWFYPKIKIFYPKLISLYDCVDYVWHCEIKLRKLLRIQEKKLIKNSDFFFVNSQVLAKLHSKTRQPTAIVPQGFRLNDFQRPLKTKVKFPKNKPIIGYVGSVDYRLDFALLHRLIKQNPQWLFVFWGPRQDLEATDDFETNRKLKTLPNVFFGQSTNRRELPNIIKQFDVCMIPYNIALKSNQYSYPMKIFEYFYLGKPVIATPIIELKKFIDLIKIGHSSQEWQEHISSLLNEKHAKNKKTKQKKLSLANSWKNKIIAISDAVKNF